MFQACSNISSCKPGLLKELLQLYTYLEMIYYGMGQYNKVICTLFTTAILKYHCKNGLDEIDISWSPEFHIFLDVHCICTTKPERLF